MKILGRASALGMFLVIGSLSGPINLCRAQVLVEGGRNPSETLVQMTSVPSSGTFWSATLSIPPSPFDPLPQLPLYAYGPASNQVYVYDDQNFDYSASSAALASAKNGGMLPMDDGSPLTPPGGGTNTSGGGGGPSFVYPDFTTNDLWLQILTMTNQTAALVIHPPWNVTNGVYDLFYTTNLAPPTPWQWVMRTAPGQTNLAPTNATGTQGFYKIGSVNSSAGTDFWVTFLFITSYSGENDGYLLSLYISSQVTNSGTVSIPGLRITNSFSLTPGTITNIMITNSALIPSYDSVTTNGIHITSSQPVSVYGLYFEQGQSIAFTGYPTSILGTNYCLLARPSLYEIYRSQFAILGTVSNTTVTIWPSATANLTGHPGTNSYTETLQQGETYEIDSTNNTDDVTGTLITSDQPIAVFAGANEGIVPNLPIYASQPLLQEQLPVVAWRNQALALSFGRPPGDSYRVLAASNNTTVTTNGVVATTLQAGQFYDTVLYEPVEFVGSNPIQVAQFALGGDADTNDVGYGGPCEILLPPTGQYLTSYTIAIPTYQEYVFPTDFSSNFLNLIVAQPAISSTLVDGSVVAATNFVPIGTSGYAGARVSVSEGTHTVSSSQPVEVQVYGFGFSDAYSYLGGITGLP